MVRFKEIFLERTIGGGLSPTYKVKINSEGKVVFDGGFLVRKTGKHSWYLDPSEIDHLNQIITKYGYFGLKGKEPTQIMTCHSYCLTKITLQGGESREIEHYLGDNMYPRRLITIENWIDKIIRVNRCFFSI